MYLDLPHSGHKSQFYMDLGFIYLFIRACIYLSGREGAQAGGGPEG